MIIIKGILDNRTTLKYNIGQLIYIYIYKFNLNYQLKFNLS